MQRLVHMRKAPFVNLSISRSMLKGIRTELRRIADALDRAIPLPIKLESAGGKMSGEFDPVREARLERERQEKAENISEATKK